MRVGFYLKRPEELKTAIYADIWYHGYRVKYYTGESINPKHWNTNTKRVKEISKFPEHPELNAKLNNIESTIKNVFRKYQNDYNQIPSPDTLKGLLHTSFNKIGPNPISSPQLIAFFEEIIRQSNESIRLNVKSGKPISKNTIKTYTTSLNHLKSFSKAKKKIIDFATIDLDFYNDFTEYLSKERHLSSNSIGKTIKILKLILNEATELGLNKNTTYKSRRFATLHERTDSIYLTNDELKELASLDLSDDIKLDKVRDLFLIGCFTGLRFSDFTNIQDSSITNGMIEITQTKTGHPVVIPIHPVVNQILDKYDGILPNSISNQKMNNYLKLICKQLASLNVQVSKSITKAGLKLNSNHKKWEMCTTHTARRSFATNEYLAGTPTITIMAITGHKTESAFMKYIKVAPNEHAKILKVNWESRAKLNIV